MRTGSTLLLSRERNLILALLLALAAASWAILIWQSTAGGGMMMDMNTGMNAPLFLALWVVMMVAMMFPTAAPMILTFAAIHGRGAIMTRPSCPPGFSWGPTC